MSTNFHEKANFIWSIADLLRGDYKQHEFQDVILPMTVLKRLDDVLEPTKEKVLEKAEELKSQGVKEESAAMILRRTSKYPFYNTSPYTFSKLLEDPDNIAKNLRAYINGFDPDMRDILDNFEFGDEIKRLDNNDLLFQVTQRFNDIDLHPDEVSNHEMGTIFEELIRRFNEQTGEAAGEHFTPREVIELMSRCIIAGNGELKKAGAIKTIYDPACGTGGMLTVAKDEISQVNEDIKLYLYGQELNPKTYAIAKADILIKGDPHRNDAQNIKLGNSFTNDQHADQTFDYMLTNPPFGVDWKKYKQTIVDEHEKQGHDGRFGAGLPTVSDGQFLFLQHMISKMKPHKDGGSRIATVFNGSPLFTGDAGRGESEIRRWVIENDWLEAIIGLPDSLFYNTGINTYIWIVTNRKHADRQGKVQLIDGREMYAKMKKTLGQKRQYLTDDHISQLVDLYSKYEDAENCKIFNNEDFGYRKITVDRPKRDENGEVVTKKNGSPEPDKDLRDFERVPLSEDIHEYFEREVKPHVPDAWINETVVDHKDDKVGKVGYEIPFTKHFYEYKPLRSVEEIDKDIQELEKESEGLLRDILDK